MPRERGETAELLTWKRTTSCTSLTSISVTSLASEHIDNEVTGNALHASLNRKHRNDNGADLGHVLSLLEAENGCFPRRKMKTKKSSCLLWIISAISAVGWGLALSSFLITKSHKAPPHSLDRHVSTTKDFGGKVKLESVLNGDWYPKTQDMSWIAAPNGQEGLLLKNDASDQDYLVVKYISNKQDDVTESFKMTLMENRTFSADDKFVHSDDAWPSNDLTKVLIVTEKEKNWRHSFTGLYWILDVKTQRAEPLDPEYPNTRIQLATWSPQSDAIVFTRENNMFFRRLDSSHAIPITRDGGPDLFYGIPDWVYEEEVFHGNSATWWSEDGEYVAFLRTDDSIVPTFPVQYFVSRPSGKKPKMGEEAYPDVRNIKYPKAGAPNPIVTLQFYDIVKNLVFSIEIKGDFRGDDRLITEVVWAGKGQKVLVRETNRESDLMKVILIDIKGRTEREVRVEDIQDLDGGWFEVSRSITFVPSDPTNGRSYDGYIDTVIHEGYDHIGYFTPLDNPKPIVLTQGRWEVVSAPWIVDLENNLVYYSSTERSSIERHPYVVRLNGSERTQVIEGSDAGYYDARFSPRGNYALIAYKGPSVPWQRLISTPSNKITLNQVLEDNKLLKEFALQHQLPILDYYTVTVNGVELNVLERRPPYFNEKSKYPVLFYQYSGPGSQTVDKQFRIDFQIYVASSLGYIVVTVDGRGTGFLGRQLRTCTRGHIGIFEAQDQIAVAKEFSKREYIDEERMAIWGWSYGGFQTLKTLEIDAGQTFRYGMAVAPVTDWRFYDTIYAERYMHMPQNNLRGYENTSISNVSALSENTRFLIMHGVADDNVHMQNTLTLLDKLDLANVQNYDVHFFPDSDHSIQFHNADKVVYEKLSSWLMSAFNGEWSRT